MRLGQPRYTCDGSCLQITRTSSPCSRTTRRRSRNDRRRFTWLVSIVHWNSHAPVGVPGSAASSR